MFDDELLNAMKKGIVEKWDKRPFANPKPSTDDPKGLFNFLSEAHEEGYGLPLSQEQFQETVNNPTFRALDVASRVGNQIYHLNNSLIAQSPSEPAIATDVVQHISHMAHKVLAKHIAVGNKDSAMETMDGIKDAYEELHDMYSDDEDFQNSYTGMHLKDMVHTTLPNLRNELAEHLGNM